MNEEEFDSFGLRPWSTEDALQMEAQWLHRSKLTATLGAALWGKTADDLKRQLLAPHPDIPSGYDLVDFRELLVSTQTIAAALAHPRASLMLANLSRHAVFIGTPGYTLWEARCEIVRRAIEYLQDR
jgi:hypothetical protein